MGKKPGQSAASLPTPGNVVPLWWWNLKNISHAVTPPPTLLLDAGHVLYAQLEYLHSWRSSFSASSTGDEAVTMDFRQQLRCGRTLQIGGPADLGACTPEP